MRALRKEELQAEPTLRNLLDTATFRLHAVPFRVIDDASPLRDLVVARVRESNASFSQEPVDQLLRFRPPRLSDGTLAVRRR